MPYIKSSSWFCSRVESLEKSMYLLAVSTLKNDYDAEDAMQSAILKAYENLDQLRAADKFKPWLFRILINECYRLLNDKTYNVDIDEFTDIGETQENLDDRITLWETVNRLDDEYRMVIILFYYEGMKIKDIAKTLEISEANVKKKASESKGAFKSDARQGGFSMKKTDRKIRKNLRTDAPCVPEGFSETFRRTLDEIKTTNRRSRRRLWQTAAVAAAVVAVTFVIIPNASQSAAYAMQDIPVIGRIVEVVTINKKHINEADWHENVEVAQIEGDKSLSSQIDYINADIRELTDIAVSQFEEERKELERRNLTAHTGLDISYDVLMNTDKWFTIRINVFYSAGSGIAEQHFYHIDKTKGNSRRTFRSI